MAQQKSKPKVKRAHAAKKKARIVRALKRHAPKARPHKQVARLQQPERVKKVVAEAKAVTAKAKPDEKAGKGKGAVKTTAKQKLELLEAKVAQGKTKGKR